jgi:sortase A
MPFDFANVKNIRLRGRAPIFFMVLGLMLLGYVSAEYYSMWREQKRLTEEWEAYNATPNTVDPKSQVRNDGLVRVVIPKIDLDAIVLEGASNKQLKLGPGRIKTSAAPGEKGNSVITAHRDTFFRHIYSLNKGDQVLIRRNGEILKFEVTQKKVVKPTDLSVLKQTADPTLTLITCYPTYFIGPAPERLVIHSKLVEKVPDTAEALSAAAAASH